MSNLSNGGGKNFNTAAQFVFTVFLLSFAAFAAQGQTVSTVPIKTEAKTVAEDETQTRIKQLEAQVSALKTELENLKKLIQPSQNKENEIATVENKTETSVAENKTEAAAVTNPKTTEVPKTQDKKPLGVDLGNVRLIPYGTIFFNAFGNSGGTNNTDVPLWATTGSGGNTSASVRQTRFGVRIEGAKVGKANLKATVEADFFGGFPSISVGESFGIVRLRLANVRLDWEKTSLIVGQDWMVFAPNSPTSIAAAAIPQMAAAGNPWSRLPQVRLERRFGKNFTFQGAVLAPATGDFPGGTNAPFLLQPGTGASSKLPFFQSRVAFSGSNWFGTKKAGSVGLSGHFGKSRVTVGNNKSDIESVGIALDWNFPIVKRVQFSGEGFFGRNLAGFQAGIFQGYNTDFAFRNGSVLMPGGVRAIGTRGGWAQIGWLLPTLGDKLTAYASVGIDDPRDEDLQTISRFNFRSRNFVYAFDLIYRFSPQFQVGAEFRRFETRYLFSETRNTNHINLGASYSF